MPRYSADMMLKRYLYSVGEAFFAAFKRPEKHGYILFIRGPGEQRGCMSSATAPIERRHVEEHRDIMIWHIWLILFSLRVIWSTLVR